MAAPSPIAQGELTKTPLAHVVMSIHGRKMSGTLAIWPTDGAGQDRVLFQDGIVKGARVLEASDDLMRALLPLFQRSGVPYAFYEEDLVGDTGLQGRVEPLALVTASLRGGMRQDVADKVLNAHGNDLLRLKRGTDFDRFGFISKEKTFIDMLRSGPISVPTAKRTAASEKIAQRVLYMLTIADALEVFEDVLPGLSDPPPAMSSAPAASRSKTPSRPSRAPRSSQAPRAPQAPRSSEPPRPSRAPRHSSPPRSFAPGSRSSHPPRFRSARPSEPPGSGPQKPEHLSKEHSLRWNEIIGYANRIDGENYFQMLGVSANAGPDEIRDAYFEKAKKWHPDRLPAELHDLKETADVIFGYLTEAERTLGETESRKAYLKAVQSGGGTPKSDRKLNTVLMAALEFQKVDVLIRRKDYANALKIVLDLLDKVPDEADYHAAHGVIVWKRDGIDAAEEALDILKGALRLNPKHERAMMTKATIFMRQNRVSDAYPLLKKILEINPKNIDAERQLRLARMRGSQPPGKKKGGGGFLSGFFGTKKK